MSAILRSRVARQVLTGTRGFASVPEVMVRERRPRRDLDARCRPTVVERIFSLFPRRDTTTRATASNPPASPHPVRSLTPHPRRASFFLSPRSAPPWCARPGPSSVMKVEHDYPVPKLAPGGVLVANKYSGINFIDTYHRSGLYKRELPFIGGQEGGGFVAAVTPEAEAQGVKVGDRVAYSSVFQTYAEYTAVPANKCVTVPEEVPLDVAVSCGVQGMTAHYLTHSAHAGLVKPGEWMLIHGTGSGTCQWAAQMAKLRGYKVIGTCSESKQDIARATGVDELIVYKEAPGTSYEDYSSVDLVPKVMEITGGEGVKAVIDGIGLATWETSIEVLARRGIFVSFGNASGAVPAFPPLRFINKSGFLTRPKLNDYTVTREELLSRANDIYGWINSGDLKVAVRTRHPRFRFFSRGFRRFADVDETNLGRHRGHTCAHTNIKQSFEASRSTRSIAS
jgi:NADPH2:quinone reductase